MPVRRKLLQICLLGVLSMAIASLENQAVRADTQTGAPRILHVMSYHTPWRWTEDQLSGFKRGLGLENAEYRVYEMDTKRRSDDAWKETAAREARQIIDTWRPDLIYANDDNAQAFVTRHYVGASVPIVFSGVNADPARYGFAGAANVTGVLETEHFVQTIRLLREIKPDIRKIAVIYDNGPTWPGVIERMRAKLPRVPDIEIVSWEKIDTFAAYKRHMRDLQDKVDAVGLLGIFTFRDEAGHNVPIETVLRWTAQNSRLPDFSYWRDRVDQGTLCAVAVSGFEQGLSAGRKARRILVDGIQPADIPIEATVKGQPFLSLARARALGIKVNASVLLSSQVIVDYVWDR